MYRRLDRAHRALPVILGALTLASVVVLFAWDALRGRVSLSMVKVPSGRQPDQLSNEEIRRMASRASEAVGA